MAILSTPESSSGILGAIKGALGLFGNTNKAMGLNENEISTPINPYTSTLTDEEILSLVSQWKKTYSVYYTEIEKSQKLAFNYWIGRQRGELSNQTLNPVENKDNVVDNLIFEAVETFLPIATRANPEPLVTADPSEIGQKMAYDIRAALIHEADVQQLRRKLAKGTRHWLLNRLGCWKVSWDSKTKSIKTDVISVKKMIFDKDGYIDERGYFIGEYIGEKKRISADILVQMFPQKAEFIKLKAHDKMGTKLEYYEWWYQARDVFYTLDEFVLGKYKNPNWNYDGEEKTIDPETKEEVTSYVQGINHFKEPNYPYLFLAIFSNNEQPHDNTSLILQNISQQDTINRRARQIDRNVQGMNEGMVVSGRAFTEDQATQAAAALRRGVAIRVPNGDVREAVLFPNRPGLPADVFNSLKDSRQELKNIFGTAGSSPEGIKSTETVRGKVLINQLDASRIGGGITEYLEQVADSIYNLWVQMMFVFYDEEHFLTSAGETSGNELITLKNDRFVLLKTLDITVKEGSLIPKDPLTQRNEAIDLWSANAIDPRTFYKRLDFPNPEESTKQLILWQMLQKGQIQPQDYLPNIAIGQQSSGMPGMLPTEQPKTGGPAVSAVNGPDIGNTTPEVTSSEAVQAQGKQLLQQIPLK